MKVFIVEDHPVNRLGLRMAAKKAANLECDVAEDYDQAVVWLEGGEEYRCVLLDHQMPRSASGKVEDIGYSLIPLIRAKKPEAIIIGTSSLKPEDIAKQGWEMPDYLVPKDQVLAKLPEILKVGKPCS